MSKLTLSELHSLLTIENVFKWMQTTPNGLSDSEANTRLRMAGLNVIPTGETESLGQKILAQLNNPLILLLLGSASLSLILGHVDDAVSIALAVLIVSAGTRSFNSKDAVAFVQEYKTEQSLKALEKLSPYYARVVRSQRHLSLPASQVVPGDIIYFESGDRIPADIRVFKSNGLSLDESSLTGETRPVYKTLDHVHDISSLLDPRWMDSSWYIQLSQMDLSHLPKISLAERRNIGFMGTLVSSGNGMGIVVATGRDTELGQICDMMNEVSPDCWLIFVDRKRKDAIATVHGLTRTTIIICIHRNHCTH